MPTPHTTTYSTTVTDYVAHSENREGFETDTAALAAAESLVAFFESPERVGAVDVTIQVHDEHSGECILDETVTRNRSE